MKHDFEAAIRHIDNNFNFQAFHNFNPQTGDAIIFALRLAQRLMQEPTEQMLRIAQQETEGCGDEDGLFSPELITTQQASQCFKSMRDQLIKEVEGEV